MILSPEIPEKIANLLFTPDWYRYRICAGGRGKGASWGFARALLTQGVAKPLRILCGRETQKSIDESVHQLMSDQIETLGLQSFFEVQRNKIIGANGTTISYAGLRDVGISNIKSFEGIDRLWIEEGENTSKRTMTVIIPTVRKDGSEIWVSLNPQLDDDYIFKNYVLNPPKNALVARMTYRDNPWFPSVLREEMEILRERDYDEYLHVYEGQTRQILEGAIFAAELRAAVTEERIGKMPHVPGVPVMGFWDMGWSDAMAWWGVQAFGHELRFIDYMEETHMTTADFAQKIQQKGYFLGIQHLPHDGDNEERKTGKTDAQILRSLGLTVKVVPRVKEKSISLNAARMVFPRCSFDEANCADGLQALRHYRYEKDLERGVFSKQPYHDWASNGADAFQCVGLASREAEKPKPKQAAVHRYTGNSSWMGA